MAQHAAHTVIGSEDKVARVRDGTAWIDLPGINDWDRSGGEREGRSTTSDSGAPTGLAGPRSAPIVELAAYAVVGHRGWDVIETAFEANDELRFQQETSPQTLLTGTGTAAISATGAVTFAGSGRPTLDDLRVGAIIRIGSNDYVIATVNPSTLATTVNPVPASQVAAAAYSIRVPALLREFAGKVLTTPTLHGSITQGGEMSGTLRVQARGVLPSWTRQAPA